MSAEANKAVARRYIEEFWNRHNIDPVDEIVSTDYLNHAASAEYQRGFAGVKHVLNWLFGVFPDHRFDIEEAVADGETVAVRGTCSGTRGRALGHPAHGRAFRRPAVALSRTGPASLTAGWQSIGWSGTILA